MFAVSPLLGRDGNFLPNPMKNPISDLNGGGCGGIFQAQLNIRVIWFGDFWIRGWGRV